MNGKQKAYSIILVLFIFALAVYGVNDFSNGNTLFSILAWVLGWNQYSFPIQTWWGASLSASVWNVFFWLVAGPSLVIAMIFAGIYFGLQVKNIATIPTWIWALMAINFIILGSGTWDAVYAFLVLNYWQNIVCGITVLWLPLWNGLSIEFTWQLGIVFIFARSIAATFLTTFILIGLGAEEDEEVRFNVPFLYRR
nr:hypothetical protein [Candidatus Freyarchaeota archaeon]